MKKTLLGIENIDYISKKTNSPVKGVSLHVMSESSRVKGHGVETIFVNANAGFYEDVLTLPLGCELDVQYNRYGAVDTIQLVKE